MMFGIYLLIRNHIVVYVGQTYDLETRLKQHKDKNWDRYHFFECHPDYMNRFEEGLIDRFRPVYNKSRRGAYSEFRRNYQLRMAIKNVKHQIAILEAEINAINEKTTPKA